MGGGDVAQLIERQVGTLLTRVQLHGTASSFQSHLSAHTLLRCPYSPHVQSHALTSVRSLKNPRIGSHTFVWTHENTAIPHALLETGSAPLAAAVALPM